MRVPLIRFFSLIFIIIMCSCDQQTDLVDPKSEPNNNIEKSSLSEVGMDENIINSMFDFLDKDSIPTIHSVLIVKDNKLVAEGYYQGFNKNARHDLRSAGKSISSILLGIAIQKGLIKDENEYVLDLLPFKKIRNNSQMKKRMQLKHVLTMTDGLLCNDCVTTFQYKTEPMQYIIGLPMEHEPGSRWFYNDATPSLIEFIVMNAAQMSMIEFMRENLYAPLNIKVSNDFNINYLRPRDMAQLGMLYLNNGSWNGKQIVPKDWVEKSTIKQTDLAPYGYFWWVYSITAANNKTYPLYAARGNGGNDIIVFPNQNMVVVFTGGDFDAAFTNNVRLLKDYILVSLND